MARRRRFKARARSIGFKRFRSRAKSSSGAKLIQIDSMAYGAVRPMAANLLAGLTSYLPLGNLSDEVGMGILNYLVAKKTSGLIRDVAVKGLVVENAMIGSTVSSGLFAGKSSSTSTSFMYG